MGMKKSGSFLCRTWQKPNQLLATMPRRKIALAVAGVLVVFAPIVLTVAPVKRDLGWIDGGTGTMKFQTAWFFGYTTPARIEESALNQWADERSVAVVRDWHLVMGTSKNIWGRPVGFGHGSTPPIYPLRDDLLASFVDSCTDSELTSFVSILRSGSESEQDAAVASAMEKAVGALENGG